MGIADLHRIDIVATAQDGRTSLIAVAVSWEPEALRLAQVGYKLATMRDYGETVAPYVIEMVCHDEQPPQSVVTLVHRLGGKLLDAELAAGRPGGYVRDGVLDWAGIQRDNAAAFAGEHGLDGSIDSLRRVDQLLYAAYAESVLADGGDLEDEPSVPLHDGDLAARAGAYVGEVMIAAFGGGWAEADDVGLSDLRVRVGPGGRYSVGAVGKVIKFLELGPSESVHGMATALGSMLAERS